MAGLRPTFSALLASTGAGGDVDRRMGPSIKSTLLEDVPMRGTSPVMLPCPVSLSITVWSMPSGLCSAQNLSLPYCTCCESAPAPPQWRRTESGPALSRPQVTST